MSRAPRACRLGRRAAPSEPASMARRGEGPTQRASDTRRRVVAWRCRRNEAGRRLLGAAGPVNASNRSRHAAASRPRTTHGVALRARGRKCIRPRAAPTRGPPARQATSHDDNSQGARADVRGKANEIVGQHQGAPSYPAGERRDAECGARTRDRSEPPGDAAQSGTGRSHGIANARGSAAVSIDISLLWSAEREIRRRAVPRGTVGGGSPERGGSLPAAFRNHERIGLVR